MMHTAVFLRLFKKVLQGEYKDQPKATTLTTVVATAINLMNGVDMSGPMP
jgi:hypothetical protein